MTGLYIYGLMPEGQRAPQASGIGAAVVETMPCGDLAALTSPAPAAVERTRRNMLAHTTVLEAALAGGTILPLRFGTVAPGPAALQACVQANRGAFHGALASVRGRVELGLKACWHKGLVYNEIVEGNPLLRKLRDRLRIRPAAETYYERIELGRRVEAALAERRASETAALIASLDKLHERAAELRPADDDMIFNHAFLVRREMEADFDDAVSRLAERHSERVAFRYVGPVPPFNFVALQAGWLTGATPQEHV